jgi:hypothetical protein
MDEAYNLIFLSMSLELLFHIEACTTLDDIWEKLEDLFGKQDDMRGYMLEVELNSLDPRRFDNIQDLFTKFKSLLLHLKGCGIEKSTQHNQLILSIFSKLSSEYVVVVSTFHTLSFTLGETWKITTLDHFIESLMHDQDKIIKMGTIKDSNAHKLVVHERNITLNPNSRKKGKGKVHSKHNKKGNSKPFDDSSNSKGGKGSQNVVTAIVIIILNHHA